MSISQLLVPNDLALYCGSIEPISIQLPPRTSFTATLTDNAINGNNFTVNSQTCYYQQINSNLYYVSCDINYSSQGSAVAANPVIISGIPVTSAIKCCGSIGWINGANLTTTLVSPANTTAACFINGVFMNPNNTFAEIGLNQNTTQSSLLCGNLKATGELIFSLLVPT